MLTRRSFLASILAAGAAPAIVRASSLMKLPEKRIILPGELLWIDTNGQLVAAYIDGYSFVRREGKIMLSTGVNDSESWSTDNIIVIPESKKLSTGIYEITWR